MDDVFELIDQFKIPVIVEFDQDAIDVWKRFEDLSKKSKKLSRNEVIQIRHTMEQYIIAVTQEDLESTKLEKTSGIYRIAHEDIERLYDQITGFVILAS